MYTSQTRWASLFVLIFFFITTGRAFASDNLLRNPSAETGTLSGWSAVNGEGQGIGWGVIPTDNETDNSFVHSGSHSFASSDYPDSDDYDFMGQEIDLLAHGFSAEDLDQSPEVLIEDYVHAGWDCCLEDNYEIVVELRGVDHEVIATYDTGIQTLEGSDGDVWTQISHAFTDYGSGLRYIYFAQKGKQINEDWVGHQGAFFDDASVTVDAVATPPTVPTFSTGEGTEENPYIIDSCEALQNIGFYNITDDQYPYLDKDFLLDDNIDCINTNPEAEEFDDGGLWSSGEGFVPIGDADNPFIGSLDGGDYTINGLYMNRGNDYVGLFGYANGSIHNISLSEVDIFADSDNVGSLVGYLDGGSIIHAHILSGVLTGGTSTGGLVGKNEGGSVSYSSSEVAITGGKEVGGLVGRNDSGDISFSYASSAITVIDRNAIGGFVGLMEEGHITDSYALGTISAGEDGAEIGGFIGDSIGTIERSYSNDNVTGGTNVGGFVGKMRDGSINDSFARGDVTGHISKIGGFAGALDEDTLVSTSYASGNVYGIYHSGSEFSVGGFAGDALGDIQGSFSAGAVNADDFVQIGGFVGYAAGLSVEDSGWWNGAWGHPFDSGTSIALDYGAADKEDFKDSELTFYNDAGWDFSETPIWDIDESEYPRKNAGWPYLAALETSYDDEPQEEVVDSGYVDDGSDDDGDFSSLVSIASNGVNDVTQTGVTIHGTLDLTALFEAFDASEEDIQLLLGEILSASPEEVFLGFILNDSPIDGLEGLPLFADTFDSPNFSSSIPDGLECGTTYYYKAVFASLGLGIALEHDSPSFTTLDCGTESNVPRSHNYSTTGGILVKVKDLNTSNPILNIPSVNMIIRDLKFGDVGLDVQNLQKFLNNNGFALADSGAGSRGNETNVFGLLTKTALARFQAANNIVPAAGYFGSITRAFIKSAGFSGLWW